MLLRDLQDAPICFQTITILGVTDREGCRPRTSLTLLHNISKCQQRVTVDIDN